MRLFREPLIQFLLLGAALFLLFHWTGGSQTSKIVVTPGKIEQLAATFERGWQRPPTQAELHDLVQDYILAEAYGREAVARGLDRDDPAITERLRMKMEVIAEGLASQTEPTDAELQAYLRAHAATYRGDAHYTFTQIFLDPAHHGNELAHDARQLLVSLHQSGDDPARIAGDKCIEDRQFTDASTADVIRAFGDDFARTLDRLPLGQWQGPVASNLGEHLVLLTQRVPGRDPPLAEVRDLVRTDLIEERRQAALKKFEHDMLLRYPAEVHWPAPAAGAAAATTAPATRTAGGTP